MRLILMSAAVFVALTVAADEPLSPIEEEMAIVEEIRSLQFLNPVESSTMTTEELREFLRRTIDEELGMSPEEYVAALRALGMLEWKIEDPIGGLLELYMSQVLAFYDPETQRFYTIEGAPAGIDIPGMARMVRVHELTHALQDQHRKVGALIESARSDWDRVSAIQALLEGEATLVMLASALTPMGFDLETALREMDLSEMMRVSLALGNVADTPPYFVHSMIFPYASGLEAVTEAYLAGGWPAVDDLYDDRTPTTAEIYDAELDIEPEAIAIEPVGDLILDTRLGEFHWRFLLGEEPGAGWLNDRVVVTRIENRLMVQMASLWRNENEAGEFETALRTKLSDLGFPAVVTSQGSEVIALWHPRENGMSVEAGGVTDE